MQKLMLPDYANTDKGYISRQFRLNPTMQSCPSFMIVACRILGKSQGRLCNINDLRTMLTGRYSRIFVLRQQNHGQIRIICSRLIEKDQDQAMSKGYSCLYCNRWHAKVSVKSLQQGRIQWAILIQDHNIKKGL